MPASTTYVPVIGGTTGHPALPLMNRLYHQVISVNLATATTAMARGPVSGDYFNLLAIPANTAVFTGMLEVTTAASSAAGSVTVDIGVDGGDTAVDGAVVSDGAASTTFLRGGTNAVIPSLGTSATGKYVTFKVAAVSVSSSALLTGVFKVHVWLCDTSNTVNTALSF